MQRVVTAEEMRWCDETAIRSVGIPGALLMEHAGRGVAEVIKQEFSPCSSKRILIVCGKGNNGGDGFVAARLLSNYCSHVDVMVLAAPAEYKGDAKANYDLLLRVKKKAAANISVFR